MFDGITVLVASSLLDSVEGADGEPRFWMLETIREYAHEQLAASGEEEAIHRRHLRHIAARAEQLTSESTTRDWEHRLLQLQPELGSIRAALVWGLEHDPVAAARLAGALDEFWIFNGLFAEGRMWVERSLTTSSTLPSSVRVRLLTTAGWLAKDQNDLVQAEAYLATAVAHARGLADETLLVTALSLLGSVALSAGDLDVARRLHEEERGLAEAAGEPFSMAVALLNLGRVSAETGDLPQGQRLLEEALVAHRKSGNTMGVALAQLFLGGVIMTRGDHASAATHFRDALHIFVTLGSWANAARALEGAAGTMVNRSSESSARLLGAAAALRERVGYPQDPLEARTVAHMLAAARVVLSEGVLAAACEAGKLLSIDAALREVDTVMADLTPAEPTEADDRHGLTRRERDVLRLLAEGRSNRLIAVALSLSERTVEGHVLHILTKLGLESRTAAATYAVRQGMV